MNNIESFLEEGILVDPSISGDLQEMQFSLVPIIKSLSIDFLSKEHFIQNYTKIKVFLENLKSSRDGEEKEAIIQTLSCLTKYEGLPGSTPQVQVIKEDQEGIKPIKSFLNRKVKILKVFNNVPKDIKFKDFVDHFKSRYIKIKNILKEHNELENLTLINKLSHNNKNISIIGMIIDKRITKNNNVIFNVEDLTGKIKVLVNINKPELIQKSKEILLDEVVGFRCSGNSEILFVNDIVFPDINTNSVKRRRTEEEEYAVFTSDIHIGSDTFLEKNFVKFVSWINGDTGTPEQKEQSKKIKYLFITGDTVDGIGVFPGQEKYLALPDMHQQYKKLAELLSKVRKDITIIICPGQHDSVRVAEPQPPIQETYAKELHALENTFFVTNPAWIEIGGKPGKEGVMVLMYHGASFHPTINEIEELRLGDAYREPTKVIKFWLKKRHLAIPYTTTTHIPMAEGDPLVIDEVPDILVTGDMHRTDVANYKGVIMINSSCWQPQTDFEAKVGNFPDPCKVPMVNLKTAEIKILDFN